MIRVHHLNNSRSQRILWLLEELDLPYELVKYQRDAVTNLAPPELEAVHPLGKSPMLELDGKLLIESGAIVEAVIEGPGGGRLAPAAGSAAFTDYRIWLHYAEGSAMLPLMLMLYTGRLGEGAAPLKPRIDSETARHLGYVEASLAGRDWLLGDALSGADIQMSFIGEIAGVFGLRTAYPAMDAWVKRFQARPAYRRALEKGGPYSFA
jgi:glutathione S-transferase